MPRRSIMLFAAACTALALLIGLGTLFVVNGRNSDGTSTVSSTGQPLIGGEFKLINQDGQPVDQSMLKGKWSLVFFGFTHCPDYCPTTLGVLNAVQKNLGDEAKDVQFILVSIDPARDTPQLLKDYLSSEGFPEGAIGLTGTPEQVAQAAKVYRAYYQKVGEGEGYTMNHSLTVYLMGPDGEFRTAMAQDLGPTRTTEIIRNEMKKAG